MSSEAESYGKLTDAFFNGQTDEWTETSDDQAYMFIMDFLFLCSMYI
jgi:hypothetical protein